MMRTSLEIDLDAVAHNYRLASARGVPVWPVIKDDAYGLGSIQIARRLHFENAPGYCVRSILEAQALRAAGVCSRIVVMSEDLCDLKPDIALTGLEFFVWSAAQLKYLSAVCWGQIVAVHLKVDTGMSRLGFIPREVDEILNWCRRDLSNIQIRGIVSHFACADEPDSRVTISQVEMMTKISKSPLVSGLKFSIANSAACLSEKTPLFDWARPGIMLYGSSPLFPEKKGKEHGLLPVCRWTTKLVHIVHIPAGAGLGYGHAFIANRPMRIGWISAGYGDGYRRLSSNGVGHVLINGHKATVVGRVCMDLTAIDLSEVPNPSVGMNVVLLGEDHDLTITTETIATWWKTIPYEITCGISNRVHRVYKSTLF